MALPFETLPSPIVMEDKNDDVVEIGGDRVRESSLLDLGTEKALEVV